MNLRYYKVTKLILLILILSFIIDYFFKIITPFISVLSSDQIIRAPSNVAIIVGFLTLYDKSLWKVPILNYLVTIPNFNGRYEGTLISDYADSKGNKIKKNCVLEISQTASKIKINSYFEHNDELYKTSSISSLEEIYCGEDNFYHIRYLYQNSGTTSKNGYKKHDGYNDLKYLKDSKTLYGPYFTSPERGNSGIINVRFISKTIKGRF